MSLPFIPHAVRREIGLQQAGRFQIRFPGSDKVQTMDGVATSETPMEIGTPLQMESGYQGTALLDASGQVWGWGYHYEGALGPNTLLKDRGDIRYPQKIYNMDNVTHIAHGPTSYHYLACKNDGTVWFWGERGSHFISPYNDSNYVEYFGPVMIPGITDAVKVYCGYQVSFYTKPDGTLWGWGRNNSGPLGLGYDSNYGGQRDVLTPTQVVAIDRPVTYLYAGGSGPFDDVSLAIDDLGRVWVWGHGGKQLSGIPSNDPTIYSTPALIPGLSGFKKAVASGDRFVLALKEDGTVWVWGQDDPYIFGDGSLGNTGAIRPPFQVPGFSNAVDIAVAEEFAFVKKADGSLWGWGEDVNGESSTGIYGPGVDSYVTQPTELVPGLVTKGPISACWGNSFHVREDCTVWGSGWSSAYQLGDDRLTARPTPNYETTFVQAGKATYQLNPILGVAGTAGGGDFSLVRMSDGTARSWGNNSGGYLGDGTLVKRLNPVEVLNLTGLSGISAGRYSSVGAKNDGTGWVWGSNSAGQAGDGTTGGSILQPQQVPNLAGVVDMKSGEYFIAALLSGGGIKAWGLNDHGQLGDGTATQQLNPVVVTGISTATKLSCGYSHSLALLQDGTVKAWGRATQGQLGNGDTSFQFTPISVSGLSGVQEVAAGGSHNLALKTDGTVWAWGGNGVGQIGDGTRTHRLTPVQVPGLSGVIAITCGFGNSFALKADGTVWAWGEGGEGQIGNGGRESSSSPTQVSIQGVSSIQTGDYHALAVKTDGTVWAWGWGAQGRLGYGQEQSALAPVQVTSPPTKIGFTGFDPCSPSDGDDGGSDPDPNNPDLNNPDTNPNNPDATKTACKGTRSNDPAIVQKSRQDLMVLAERALGKTLSQAFPREWNYVLDTGNPRSVSVQAGSVPISLELRRRDTAVTGAEVAASVLIEEDFEVEYPEVSEAPGEALRDDQGRGLYSLMLTKVEPTERNRFHALDATDTYFEIKKGEVGDRVAYSVNMTDEEYSRAASDVSNPNVNLLHIEPVSLAPPPSTGEVPGPGAQRYLGMSPEEVSDYDGRGITVGVTDSGLAPVIRDQIFGGRIKAARGFAGLDPFDDQNGHGTKMVPIAVPPASKLALAGVANAIGSQSDWVAAGINWLVDEVGINVLCIEAQDNVRTTVVDDAVSNAATKGVFVAAPAGNGGMDFAGNGQNIEGSPAGSPGANTITNYNNQTDSKAASSRFGSFVWAASTGSPLSVYTPTGGVEFTSDGGTSAGVAVLADFAARTMGAGYSAAQAKTLMQNNARRTGAPVEHEGVGVLQFNVPAKDAEEDSYEVYVYECATNEIPLVNPPNPNDPNPNDPSPLNNPNSPNQFNSPQGPNNPSYMEANIPIPSDFDPPNMDPTSPFPDINPKYIPGQPFEMDDTFNLDAPPLRGNIEQIELIEGPGTDCRFPQIDFGGGGCQPSPGNGGGFSPGAGPTPGTIDIGVRPPYGVDDTFNAKKCYVEANPKAAVVELCGIIGLNPAQVMWKDPCDKKFSKCFEKGSRIFDAIWWIADYCGYKVFDPGTGIVEIVPDKPLPIFWVYHEGVDLMEFSRNYDALDVHYAVEVWRPQSSRRGAVVIPEFIHLELTKTPFQVSENKVYRIEAPPDWSNQRCVDEAKSTARSMRGGLTVTIAVPLNMRMSYRHQIIVVRPSKGFAARYMVEIHNRSIATEGSLSVCTARFLSFTTVSHQNGSPFRGQGYVMPTDSFDPESQDGGMIVQAQGMPPIVALPEYIDGQPAAGAPSPDESLEETGSVRAHSTIFAQVRARDDASVSEAGSMRVIQSTNEVVPTGSADDVDISEAGFDGVSQTTNEVAPTGSADDASIEETGFVSASFRSATTSFNDAPLTELAVPGTVEGSLDTTDSRSWSRGASYYADYYDVKLTAGVTYRLGMRNSSTDTYGYLLDQNGTQLTSDDDSGGSLQPLMFFTPITSGTYILECTTYSATATASAYQAYCEVT